MPTNAQTEREVIRCPSCDLNQYMTRSGLCRKCEEPLKYDLYTDKGVHAGEMSDYQAKPVTMSEAFDYIAEPAFYRPTSPFVHPLAEAERAIDTLKEILVSNVRRKKVDPRYKRDSMLIRDVPADFRQKLIEYCKENKITLRDLVVNSVQKELDRE